MDLNEYVMALETRQNPATPICIEIPLDLSQILYKTKEESEEKVIEIGYNLRWNEASSRLEIIPEKYEGETDRVALESSEVKNREDYIGDFHVHPYRQKYGEQYSLGPSSPDWDGWLTDFPVHRSFSVNIVASGNKLFLALFTQKPKRVEIIKHRWHNDTTKSANIIQTFFNANKYLSLDFSDAIKEKRWGDLRELYSTHIPDYPSTHQQDVSDMNKAIAELNYGCAFYEGPLSDKKITTVWLKGANSEAATAPDTPTTNKCFTCGQRHGSMFSNPFNAWHICTKCDAVYCPEHGMSLAGKGAWYDRTRTCTRCGSRTRLVSRF